MSFRILTKAWQSLTRKPSTLSRSFSDISFPSERPSFGIAFDIDGVILLGNSPVGGSPAALRRLYDDAGKLKVPYVFLTNGGGFPESRRAFELSQLLGVNVSSSQVMQGHSPFKQFVNRNQIPNKMVSEQFSSRDASTKMEARVDCLEQGMRSLTAKLDGVEQKMVVIKNMVMELRDIVVPREGRKKSDLQTLDGYPLPVRSISAISGSVAAINNKVAVAGTSAAMSTTREGTYRCAAACSRGDDGKKLKEFGESAAELVYGKEKDPGKFEDIGTEMKENIMMSFSILDGQFLRLTKSCELTHNTVGSRPTKSFKMEGTSGPKAGTMFATPTNQGESHYRLLAVAETARKCKMGLGYNCDEKDHLEEEMQDVEIGEEEAETGLEQDAAALQLLIPQLTLFTKGGAAGFLQERHTGKIRVEINGFGPNKLIHFLGP